MSNPRLTASGPALQPSGTEPVSFDVQSVRVTQSWGVQPGEGAVRYVSHATGGGPTLRPGDLLWVDIYGRQFHGICTSNVWMSGSSGKTREVRFADHRILLDWDIAYGAWNVPEHRLIDGKWRRVYWHVLCRDFATGRKTWTNSPMSAIQILDDIFNRSPTLRFRWAREYHSSMNVPPPAVEALQGRKLADIVAQITEACGAVVTVDGHLRLRWSRVDARVQVQVPENADEIQDGEALAHQLPGCVHVVGDRNLYQVLNIDLEPDWNREWEQYWDESGHLNLTRLVYNEARVPGRDTKYSEEDDRWHGWAMAAVRATSITVAEVAALKPELSLLADNRLTQGRLRMQIPAALYLRRLVYRAYRLPNVIRWTGVDHARDSLSIGGECPMGMEYDPTTGMATVKPDGYSGGAGLVLVSGYNVGADLFRMVRPETLDPNRLAQAESVWATCGFEVDDGGEASDQVLILERAAYRIRDALTQRDGHMVFRGDQLRIEPSAVRASLPLLAEPYVRVVGNGWRAELLTVSGLRRECVVADPSTQSEVPYIDGTTADQKALEIGNTALGQAMTLASGSMTIRMRPGEAMTRLEPVFSRVTAEWGADGHNLRLEFARERPRQHYVPETELNRTYRLNAMLDGMAELRAEGRAIELQRAALRGATDFRARLENAYQASVGDRGPVEFALVKLNEADPENVQPETLPAGTPLWKEPGTLGNTGSLEPSECPRPAATTSAHREFVGVTVRDQESTGTPMAVQNTGMVLVRARGPVAVHTALVRADGHDYLKADDGSSPAVLTALQDVPEGETRLIRAFSAGGSSSGGPWYWA